MEKSLIETEEKGRTRQESLREERKRFREFLDNVRPEDFGNLDEFE